MRISYQNIEQLKQMARILANSTNMQLMACQQALAQASGYRDWFELSVIPTHQAKLSSATNLSMDEKVSFALKIARQLGASECDVQFAMSEMNVFQWRCGIREQLEIRAKLLRQTSLPDLGRRQTGTVGKFKNNGRPLILRSFGKLVSAVGHSGHDSVSADFEFVTTRKPIPLFVPGRLYYAYGSWTEADGSVVLHSRDYLPLWRISSDKRPTRLNPADWIEHDGTSDQWFWEDATSPWDNATRHAEEIARLESFGVRGLPYLADTLADMVLSPRPLNPKRAAQNRFGLTSNRSHLQMDAA